jgi:glycosyltransferase involved in cell wall biosynthesis
MSGHRLLVITTNFPRWEGDPHSPWLVELLGYLRERGIVAEILAPSFAGLGDQVVHGMKVHRFRYAPSRWETMTHEEGAPNKIRRNPLYLLLLPVYLVSGMVAAGRLARSRDFDILHVHWPVPQGLLGLVARWAAGGGRLVATFYGADLVMARRFGFTRPFLAAFARRCDDVAAISSYTARQLGSMTGLAPRTIPYGIALPPADAAWPTESGLILTVGRLIARKGHADLIQAMVHLQAHPHARLVIVGEGHERPALESLIQDLGLADRVTLMGRVSDQELERLYAACHVFVLPAIVDSTGDTEMLGMVLLEAMRYRKPVVATRVGGIADIVQDGENGCLVEQRNPQALAGAIGHLLEDGSWAERLGRAGYQSAHSRFSWTHVIRQVLALYGLESEESPDR